VGKEALHLLVVPGEHKHHFTPEILHLGKEVVEDSSATRVVTGGELVGLVNEQDASALVRISSIKPLQPATPRFPRLAPVLSLKHAPGITQSSVRNWA
jgi:hypothetical protein